MISDTKGLANPRSVTTRVKVLVSVLRELVLVSAIRFVLVHVVEGIPFVSHHFVSLSPQIGGFYSD